MTKRTLDERWREKQKSRKQREKKEKMAKKEKMITGEPTKAEPKPAKKKPSRPVISWSDIAGCEEAIAALREAIEFPTENAELFAAYGQQPAKGVLLYGPPGNGKTLLARAVVTATGGEEELTEGATLEEQLSGRAPKPLKNFHYIKGSELHKPYVGEAEAVIKKMFADCRAYQEKTGKRAVIFIDEADSILGDRAKGHWLKSHLVSSFLAELDGLEDTGVFVLLASNWPDSIDPAILRDGRIDRRIMVGRPSRETAKKLLTNELGKKPLAGELESLVTSCLAAVFDPKLALWQLLYEDGSSSRVCFSHVISGALLVGLVQRATGMAMQRDRAEGRKTPGGITEADLRAAVWQAHCEQVRTKSLDVVREVVEAGTHQMGLVMRAEYGDLRVPHEPVFKKLEELRGGVEAQKKPVSYN